MKYKAIITDVDGTLLLQGKTGTMHLLPSERVTHAIRNVKSVIHFGIATSRPIKYVEHLFDSLGLTAPCIVQSGAIIIDPQTKHVLWFRKIEENDFTAIVAILTKHKLSFVIDEVEKSGIVYTKSYKQNNPVSIFVSEISSEMVTLLKKDLGSFPHISIHQVPSWDNSKWAININHVEATKQHAVMQVTEILHITTHEMIGVGDGYNDFPLLMACGLKVAMGNAVDDLKAIADYIAPSVQEDGLATVIEKFVLH